MDIAFRRHNLRSDILVVFAVLLYTLTFSPLYNLVGNSTAALVLIPVALAGFYYGVGAGIVAGLLTLPLNFLLFSQFENSSLSFHFLNSLPPIVIAEFVGAFSGWLHGLLLQTKEQARQLQKEIFEREKSEEQLKQSSERLELALHGADLGLWDVDTKWEHAVFNDRWAEMLGFTKEEIGSSTDVFWKLIHPDDQKMVRDALEAHLSGKSEIYETEHRMKAKSGEWKWVLNRGKVVERYPDGSPRRVAGTHLDITERKKNIEWLQVLGRAIDAAMNGIVITDPLQPGNPIIFANPAFEKNTGYSRNEAIGRNPRFLQGVDTNRETAHSIRTALERGEGCRVVIKNYRKDGSPFWNELSISPMRDHTGKIVNFIGIQSDITEKRLMHEALQQSEEKFRCFIEQSSDGIFLTDEEGLITQWNRAERRITGLAFEEVAHQPVWEVQHWLLPKSRQTTEIERKVKKRVQKLLQTGGGDWAMRPFEQEVYRRDGSALNVEAVVFPIKTPKGYLMGSIMRDISKQKRTNEELRRLNRAVESTQSGIVLASLDGVVEYVNPGLLSMHAYDSKEEVLGRSIFEFTDGAGREMLSSEIIPQLLISGKWSGELLTRKKDGSFIQSQMICSMVYGQKGEPVSLFSNFYDITERKLAEHALEESESKYRSVVENIKEVIFRTDVTGNWTYLNPAWCEISGYSIEESLGLRCLDFVHPDDRERSEELFKPLINREKEYCRHEVRYLRKDGGECWIEVYARLTSDDDGNVSGTTGTLMDITNRRRADEALRNANDMLEAKVAERTRELQDAVGNLNFELEERKRAEEMIREQAMLLDEAHDAISVSGLDGKIRFWNKSAERLYGWSAQEVVGLNANDLERKAISDKGMKTLLESGEWSGELERRKKDGTAVVVDSRWTLVRDAKGEPLTILVIDTDITEKKQLQAQFLRAQRMESIGTLAGGIAHDLNNILTPVMMWSEVLRSKMPDEKSQRILSLLESSVQRGADMVRQVLSFSRGISGERVEMQFKHILKDLEKIMQESFPKSIEIVVDVPKDLWTVMGDATQLHQVLMNLCVNARDAMPHGGTLTASCDNMTIDDNYARMHLDAKPGNYVAISVADSGTGIPPETLERIFEPFFTTKEIGKGTGLGLSTSVAIVKSHGGFINVYSEVGRGTTFKMYVPAVPGLVQREMSEKSDPLMRGNGETLLVIDDEAIIRESIKGALEEFGYNVLIADDGAQAIAVYMLHQREIAAVITDMMMPFMDGVSTIRALRRIDPGLKIIAASGLADNERILQKRNLSVDGFLRKPYTTRDLLTMLFTILGKAPKLVQEEERS